MNRYLSTLKTITLCALGGFLGSAAFTISPLSAAMNDAQFTSLTTYNSSGKRTAYLGPGDNGQGTYFLFDKNGGLSVQMGSYGSGSESGQSLLGLHDKNEHLRLLFRMYGPSDSPTLIMKDESGRDRIVMGLDGSTQEPYLNVTDSSGQTRDILKP